MYKLILILLGLLTVSELDAQSISLTLRQAQDMAIDSSYAMRNARYNTEKKRQEVREILAIGLPQVNAQAEYTNYFDIPTSVIPGGTFGDGGPGSDDPKAVQFGMKQNMNAGITASQLIFDGTYLVGLKASKIYVSFTENQALQTEQEIREAVAEAYHTVLLADANIEILQESIESLEKTLSDTEALYGEGLTEEQDVDQIKLNLNQYRINIDETTAFRVVSEQLLNFLIGIPLDRKILLADRIEDLVEVSNNQDYLTREPNLLNHPDYLVAQTNLQLQDLNIKGEKAAYYPSLSAFYNYQQVAQRDEFNFLDGGEQWYPTSLIGVTLNVPIWSSFQRKARVEQAEIGHLQGQLMMTQTEENLKLEVRRTRSNYDNALKIWENQKESIRLARSISQKTQIKYSEGISSSFELNVAERQLLTEQERFIKAAFDVLSAKQQLDRALNIY